MSATDFAPLVALLSQTGPLRLQALEILCGVVSDATPEVVASLNELEVPRRLLPLVGSDDLHTCVRSLATLVNLAAASTDTGAQLLAHGAIDVAMDCIKDPQHHRPDYAADLIANITQSERGRAAFLQLESRMKFLHLLRMLHWFIHGALSGELVLNKLAEHHVNVLVNVSMEQNCRDVLLDPKRGILPKLTSVLRSSALTPPCRLNTLRILRNCAFDSSASHVILDREVSDLAVELVDSLGAPGTFSDQDIEPMAGWVAALARRGKPAPADEELRTTAVEALTLLAANRKGRILLKEWYVYPIIRELDICEKDEAIQVKLRELVQFLIAYERDEHKPGDAPPAPAGASVEEVQDDESQVPGAGDGADVEQVDPEEEDVIVLPTPSKFVVEGPLQRVRTQADVEAEEPEDDDEEDPDAAETERIASLLF